MIKNVKVFENKLSTCKLVLVTISAAVGMTLTGCGTLNNNQSATIDRSKIDTETTQISERKEYYKKNVDDLVDEMTEEEKKITISQ